MDIRASYFRFLLLAALGVVESVHAQAPESAIPEASPSREASGAKDRPYQRPNLHVDFLKLDALPMEAERKKALARALAVIACNFPDDPEVENLWRSRALALALFLDSTCREAHVANGQLARKLAPKPLPNVQQATAREYATVLLNYASEALKFGGEGKKLGAYLVDICVRLDPQYEDIKKELGKDAQVSWAGVVPDVTQDEWAAGVEEEVADLEATSAKVPTLQFAEDKEGGKWSVTLASAAARRQEGGRKALQLYLSPQDRGRVAPYLNGVRAALRKRHPDWPSGWLVDLSFPSQDQNARPGLESLPLGLLLDSLIEGSPISLSTLPALHWQIDGTMAALMSVPQILDLARANPQIKRIIIPISLERDIKDFLILNPQRLSELARTELLHAKTFAEVVTLSRESPSRLIAQSYEHFAWVAPVVAQSGADALKNPDVIKALEDTASRNPNHLSARLLLAVAKAEFPKQLSLQGSADFIATCAGPILYGGSNSYPFQAPASGLDKTIFTKARLQLERRREVLDPAYRGYVLALIDLAKIWDTFCVAPPKTNEGRAELLKQARALQIKIQAERAKLAEAKQARPKR